MNGGVLVFVLLTGQALASDVSPVEKVVTMLEDLQTQVVVEGKAEAKTYDKFACFCKDMTAEKTDAINAGTDKSADLSALIEQLTNDRSEADDDINELNKKIDELDKSMKENKEKRAAEKATFDALHAELTKGIKDLTNAVNTLQSSRPASLMSLKSVIKTIRQAAFMGDAMGHSPKNQQSLAALLQQDPEVPMEDFTFHSEEIISMIEGLQSDFKTKLSEVKIAETKAVSDFDLQMQADTDERAAAAKGLKDTTELKAEKMEAIAASSKELTETSATLTDDQNYLKDLTEKCNAKSKEWDQRSQMRQDELTALTTALTIVKDGVATKTTEKTVRLVQSAAKVSPHSAVVEESADSDDDDDVSEEDLSFVQLSSPRTKLSLVATGANKFLQPSDSTRDRVIALLKSKSTQLDSPVLAALATKAAADPFVKIKKLIQELIERLLQEAADEANH